MVSSTLIQNSICPEWQRAVRAEQGGKGGGVERESRSSNRGEGGAPSTLPGVRHRFDGLSSSLRRPASGTLPGVACGRKNMTRHLHRHCGPAAAPHPSPCRRVVSASPRLRCQQLGTRTRATVYTVACDDAHTRLGLVVSAADRPLAHDFAAACSNGSPGPSVSCVRTIRT
jgi:hypothetical protein